MLRGIVEPKEHEAAVAAREAGGRSTLRWTSVRMLWAGLSLRRLSLSVRYLPQRRRQLDEDSGLVRSRQREAGFREEPPPRAASQRPGQMEDVGRTAGHTGDATEGEPRTSSRAPAHQVGTDGGLSLRLLSRRRAGHVARSATSTAFRG